MAMVTKQQDQFSDEPPPAGNKALLALDVADPTLAPFPIINEVAIEAAGFVPATEEALSHVMPGCFVLALIDDAYCWVEIEAIEGHRVGARLHNELPQSACLIRHHAPQSVVFHRDQIKALGCERYCWC
jgi:hypothetical protein